MLEKKDGLKYGDDRDLYPIKKEIELALEKGGSLVELVRQAIVISEQVGLQRSLLEFLDRIDQANFFKGERNLLYDAVILDAIAGVYSRTLYHTEVAEIGKLCTTEYRADKAYSIRKVYPHLAALSLFNFLQNSDLSDDDRDIWLDILYEVTELLSERNAEKIRRRAGI